MLRRLLLALAMLLVLAAAPAVADLGSSHAGAGHSTEDDRVRPTTGVTHESWLASTPARGSADALRAIVRLALGIAVAITLLVVVAPIRVSARQPRRRVPGRWRSFAAPPTRAPPAFAPIPS
jgi:hypothetical protein